MKTSLKKSQPILAVITALALCGAAVEIQASGGSSTGGSGGGGGGGGSSSTSTLPVSDAGGLLKSGGGGATHSGGGSVTPTPTPAPAPAPAINTGTVKYAASGPVNGIQPVCIGDWRIDPYYPTLLDMTMNVHVSSLNVPDGTVLYVSVAGSQAVYPFTSNAISIVAGAGSCSEQIFIYPGTTLTGVIISDASGNVLFAGN